MSLTPGPAPLLPPASARVWVNGRLGGYEELRISPVDQGFTTGHGVFETLRAYKGKPFSVMRHWKRLVDSCKKIYVQSPSENAFRVMIEQTIAANQIQEARVRVTVTGGVPAWGAPAGSPGVESTMVCAATPAVTYTGPEKVSIVPWPRNERGALSGVKSLSYSENILALQHARQQGAGEAIYGNIRGELCEGATTNVFLVQGEEILTPPLDSGCLPGVTRSLVLELGARHGLPIRETSLPLAALDTADEIFLTSATREVQAVSHVNGRPLSRSAGPQSQRLAELLRKLISDHADP